MKPRILLALMVAVVALLPVACAAGSLPWESLGLVTIALGMAVAANQVTPRSGCESRVKILAGNGEHLYGGTLVFFDSDGYAVATAGGNVIDGVLTEKEVDNSSGADGAVAGEVYIDGSFVLTGTGFAQTDVGTQVFAIDNYTVTTTSTSNSYVGIITEFISSTKVRVKIDVTAAGVYT
jgi:hypothetical protein